MDAVRVELNRTVRTPLESLYGRLKLMISHLMKSRRIADAEISVTFVGDRRIRALNRDYLKRDRVTDVIAFNLSEPDDPVLLGDIYICVPRAERQAEWYGSGREEELARLTAHGVLHVLGFDHEIPDEASRMNELQEELVRFFLSSGK